MAAADVNKASKTKPAKEKDAALFVKEIERLAKAGNFVQAEKLREKLLEAHPMALSEIIAAADVIEAQKATGIDQDHLAIWDKLYGKLSQDETNSLFYSCKQVTVPPNKIILAQGKLNPRLFLIDSGRVTLFYRKGDNKVLIGQLSRGDVLGEDAFFEISHSTLSAASQTEVKLRYLEQTIAREWEDSQPGLLQKLGDYCLQNGKMRELMQQKRFEKRLHPRKKVAGRIMVHILTLAGKRSGAYFRGGLQDISQGGLCFDMRCSKSATARALLGRDIEINLEKDEQAAAEAGKLFGQVVRVSFHMYNDYSVHVHLKKDMSASDYNKYLALLLGAT